MVSDIDTAVTVVLGLLVHDDPRHAPLDVKERRGHSTAQSSWQTPPRVGAREDQEQRATSPPWPVPESGGLVRALR